MSRHTKIHSTVKNHNCMKCNKSFSRKDLLQKHIRSCTRSKKETPGNQEMPGAKKENVGPQEPLGSKLDKSNVIFKCDHCDKCFPHKRSLKRHLRNHDKPTESFSCNTCEKRFSREDSLYHRKR